MPDQGLKQVYAVRLGQFSPDVNHQYRESEHPDDEEGRPEYLPAVESV